MSESFSTHLAAPSDVDADSDQDEDDGDNDTAERDDDVDSFVELAARHHRRRVTGRRPLVSRCLEFQEAVGGTSSVASSHSQHVPRRRMYTHSVCRLYTPELRCNVWLL